jgi:O-acetyl-ADP-ribose deacetylase (regulator of RNase III)
MSSRKIELARGDITKQDVDAIVNAANTTLLGGGGVDGAIHRAAGPELVAECRTLGGCRPGEAKITRGYRLPARFVIHTVGPVWSGGKHGEPETLANCYRNSLHLALENRIKTIAFPAISCGAYGYPIGKAARIALETTRKFLALSEIQKVIFVVWGDDIYDAYESLLEQG